MHNNILGALVDFARSAMGVELQVWQRDFIRSTYGPLMYERDRVFWTPNLLYRPGEYQGPAGPVLPRPWLVVHEIPPVDLEAVTWSPRSELQIAQANADTYMVKLANINVEYIQDHVDKYGWSYLKAVHDKYLVTDSDNDKPTNTELREALVDVLNNGDTANEDHDHLTPAVRDALTKGGWNSAGISRIHSSEDETTPVYHVYHDNGREDDVKRPWPKDDVGESDDLIDEDDDALTTEELHDMHIPGQPPEPSAEDLEYARQHAGVVAAFQRYGFSRQESMALLFQELHADLAREIYNRDNPF